MNKKNIFLLTFVFLASFLHGFEEINVELSKLENRSFQIVINDGENSIEDILNSKIYFKQNEIELEVADESPSVSLQQSQNGKVFSILFDNDLGEIFTIKINGSGEMVLKDLEMTKNISVKTFGNIYLPDGEISSRNLYIKAKEIHNRSQFVGNSYQLRFAHLFKNHKLGSLSSKSASSIKDSRKSKTAAIANHGTITSKLGLTLQAGNIINHPKAKVSTKENLKILSNKLIDNSGTLHSDGDQIIEGFKIVNSGKIEILGKINFSGKSFENFTFLHTKLGGRIEMLDEVHNFEGNIISDGNLEVIAGESILNERGKFDLKWGVVFVTSGGTFKNLSGHIIASEHLRIVTDNFINTRMPVLKFSGESTKGNYYHTVQGPYELESYGPGIIISRRGDFNLETTLGRNEAGLISSGKNTSITANHFENWSRNLRNEKHTRESHEEEDCILLFCSSHTRWSTKKKNYPVHSAAAIIAGENFDFRIGEKKISVDKTTFNPFLAPDSLINTGKLESCKTLTISADYENECTEFLNGLFDDTLPTAIAKPRTITVPIFPLLPYTMLKESIKLRMLGSGEKESYFFNRDNPRYFLDYFFTNSYDYEEYESRSNIGRNLFAYTEEGAYLLQSNPNAIQLMSPSLRADSLANYLLYYTGTPYLRGFYTAEEQDTVLRTRGFWQSVINGKTILVDEEKVRDCENVDWDEDKEDLMSLIIEGQCEKECPSVEQVKKRLCKIEGGSHIPVLTAEQIENAERSMNAFTEIEVDGESYLGLVAHISEDEIDLYTDGALVSLNGEIKTDVPYTKNTGTIRGNEISIRAYTFDNERRIIKEKQEVYQKGGIFKSGYMRTYEVRIPQPGGNIHGAIVTIEALEDVKNTGGTITTEVSLRIISRNGDVIIAPQVGSHVVKWDAGWLGDLLGKRSSALVEDIYPGKIVSNGVTEIISETGRVINRASQIIGRGDVNIQSYLKAIIEGVSVKWVSSDSLSTRGFKIVSRKEEKVKHTRAVVTSLEGDINIVSLDDMVEVKGSTLQAGRNVTLSGEKGVYLGPQVVKTKISFSQTGFTDPLTFSHSETTSTQDNVFLTLISAGESININSNLDNILEAVIMTSNEAIYVVAGRDNIFKGYEQEFSTETTGFSVGVSFFGSETIKSAIQGDFKGAVWNLADEDPLLRALHGLKDSKDGADISGSSVYVGMETAKLLLAADAVLKTTHGTFKGLIGERLGLTRMDKDGKSTFDPKITVRLGAFESSQKQANTVRTHIETGKLYVISDRDTKWIEGTTAVASEKVTIKADGNLEVEAAEDTFEQESSSAGVSASIGGKSGDFLGAGVDFAESQAEGKTYYNAMIVTPESEIDVDGDFIAEGFDLLADEATINIGGDFYFKSKQNTFDSSSSSGSFGVGVGAGVSLSGSYGEQEAHSAKTQISKISGKKVYITVGGKVKAVGVLFQGGEGSFIRAKAFEYEDLEEYDFSDGFHFSLSTPSFGKDVPPSQSGNWGSGDFDVHNKYEYGKTRATVSEEIEIDVEEDLDLEGLCRSEECMQVTTSKGGSHFRLVIPLNIPGFIEDLNSLKDMFKSKEEVGDLFEKVKEIKEQIKKENGDEEIPNFTVSDEESTLTHNEIEVEEEGKTLKLTFLGFSENDDEVEFDPLSNILAFLNDNPENISVFGDLERFDVEIDYDKSKFVARIECDAEDQKVRESLFKKLSKKMVDAYICLDDIGTGSFLAVADTAIILLLGIFELSETMDENRINANAELWHKLGTSEELVERYREEYGSDPYARWAIEDLTSLVENAVEKVADTKKPLVQKIRYHVNNAITAALIACGLHSFARSVRLSSAKPNTFTKTSNPTRTRFLSEIIVEDIHTGKKIKGTVDLKSSLDRIASGKKLPYRNDGSTFRNYPLPGQSKPLLPIKPNGYYKEFVHPTEGIKGPGPQRIITGERGEIYYTPDHYKTFFKIQE